MYDEGYIVFEVGYIVFEVGYIVFAGYVLQRSNSSQTSQRDGQTQPTTRPASEDKFDYEPTSFPPLPGSEVITITGFILIYLVLTIFNKEAYLTSVLPRIQKLGYTCPITS